MANTSYEDVVKTSEELRELFGEFKGFHTRELDELKKKGVTQAILKEQTDRVNVEIDSLDKKFAEQMKDLEAKTKLPKSSGSNEVAEEMKAYSEAFWGGYGKKGHEISDEIIKKARAINEFRSKALIASDDTLGGYLAPPEFVVEILKTVTEFSPVRALARVRPTSRRASRHPVRNGQFSAAWVAEQGTRSETTGLTYKLEEIPNHEVYARVDVSVQDLEDSAFNLETEIRSEGAEQFSVAEGLAFIKGNGVGKPEGITQTASNGVGTTASTGASSTIAADDLITFFYGLKDSYARNATWLILRANISSVRKLKGSDNNYLWQPGLQGTQPPTILGRPYLEALDLEAEGTTGNNLAILGDFRRGYVISDRVAIDFVRDPFTVRESGNIKFLMTKRVGGQVVLSEALRILQAG